MNILVICHYGLYQNLSFSFVHNQIKEFVKIGHQVRAIVPIAVGKKGPKGKSIFPAVFSCIEDGVQLRYLRFLSISNYGKKSFNTRSAIAAVAFNKKKLLDEFQPDVIYAHTLGFDSEIGAWLKKVYSCPLVVTTHGSDTSILYEKGEKLLLKTLCDKVDAVGCVSSKLKRQLLDCGTSVRLETILNGFRIQEKEFIQQKASGTWIQVSHLIPSKGVDVTIQAFADFVQKYPNAMLTIIGKGELRNNLETLCRKLGILHAVRFLGEISNAQVLEEMAKAQFFVMPSSPEGFGIVYLEAMSVGCVAIGTVGEGIEDLIISGQNGFLVEAKDVQQITKIVDRCMKDPRYTGEIALRGQQDVKKLTWQANAAHYIRLFTEVANDGSLDSR